MGHCLAPSNLGEQADRGITLQGWEKSFWCFQAEAVKVAQSVLGKEEGGDSGGAARFGTR